MKLSIIRRLARRKPKPNGSMTCTTAMPTFKEIAAALESTYQQLGSPVPLEKGHWLAFASAIAPYLT